MSTVPTTPAGTDEKEASGPPPSHFETIACPACGEREHTVLTEACDDYTGKPGRFRFVTCDGCSLAYQNPRLRFEHIGPWYDREYIAHRRKTDWGLLTPLYERAMGRHDRAKLALVRRHVAPDESTRVLDVGCGAGGFAAHVRDRTGAAVTGVDFKDLSASPALADVEFRHGRLLDQAFGERRFDLITMWHFLEHDYDGPDTLRRARDLLSDTGHLVVEVPRLDSLTRRLFGRHWPGLQAPQHTTLYTRRTLLDAIERAGLRPVEYLPWGAFPPFFYLFTGVAFTLLRGRGLDLQRAIGPYFVGQALASPITLFHRRINLAMQTVVCTRD